MLKIINVEAVPGSNAFLVITEDKTALVDSGFSFCAEKMIDLVKSEIGEKPLDFCFLTHSHYDHASGSAYLKKHFPDVKIVADEYAAKIFSKPSAISVIKEMNGNAALEAGVTEYEEKLENLQVDIEVNEGDILDFGKNTVQVIAAPGHTKCSIAYYIPEEKTLLSSETMGVYIGDDLVIPGYMIGYNMSIDFIKRVKEMDIEKILISHYGVLEGNDCKKYMDNALRCAEMLKNIIIEEHINGKSYNEILASYKNIFLTEQVKKHQPLKAFELNASYMIPMIIKECS